MAAVAAGVAGAQEPLVAALGQPRVWAARLTGGFPHGPLASTTAREPASLLAALPVMREIEVRAQHSAEARDHHELGRLQLLLGKAPEAVAALQRALALLPAGAPPAASAAICSDLAAAFLAQVREEPAPLALARALALADQAVAADAQLPEAHFNRALALEGLALHGPARLAWEAFLQLDPHSAWADEAREHVAALVPTTPVSAIEQRQQLARLAAAGWTDELQRRVRADFKGAQRQVEAQLAEWGQEQLAARPAAAAAALAVAGTLAGAIRHLSGDALMADAVAAIETRQGRGAELEALARGHVAYLRGLELFEQTNVQLDGAASTLVAAAQQLHAAGSPLALRAELFAALCDYFRGFLQQAQTTFEQLYRRADASRYPLLAGRLCWLAGLTRSVLGDPLVALRWFLRGEPLYAAAGEAGDLAAVRNLIGDTLDQLGDDEGAWRYGFAALRQLPYGFAAGHGQGILQVIAERFRRAGEVHVALYFEDQKVILAERTGDPALRLAALRTRARLRQEAGLQEAAAEDLRLAGELLAEIADPAEQLASRCELRATEGILLRRWGAPQAVAMLTEALALAEQMDYRYVLLELYLERARAHLAAGAVAAAARDLAAGIAEVEDRRQHMPEAARRTGFFEQSRALYEEMIGLQAGAGEAAQALEYAERARARTLLEQMLAPAEGDVPAHAVAPLTAAQLQASLPEEVALVEYAVLDDRLLCWVLDRRQLVLHTLAEGGTAGLAERVRALQAALRGGAEVAVLEEHLEQLHELLIAPLGPSLARYRQLLVVPDGELYAVPFSALRARATGRYLIEDQAVAVLPSASVWAAGRERAGVVAPPRSALVVGAPAFDRDLFPLLPELPAAAQEAAEVARLYPQSQLLTAAGASKAELLAGLPVVEVLHFAGHAVVNDADPGLSALLLAPDGDQDASGVLYARELQGRRWPQLRLVVLGACRSGHGRVLRAEGVQSLARWFLAAGAEAVVASLWDVDDGAASELLVALHRHIASGAGAVTALAEAQRAQLQSPDPARRSPAHWAAFELTGGVGHHPEP